MGHVDNVRKLESDSGDTSGSASTSWIDGAHPAARAQHRQPQPHPHPQVQHPDHPPDEQQNSGPASSGSGSGARSHPQEQLQPQPQNWGWNTAVPWDTTVSSAAYPTSSSGVPSMTTASTSGSNTNSISGSDPGPISAFQYPDLGMAYPMFSDSKELSTGRWTAEEHRVFLQALAEQRGPAWSEISRKIRTRSATQVRTHAQKFFTKLARRNQTWPHFEDLVEKERVRLVKHRRHAAHGGSTSSSSSTVASKPTTSLLRSNQVSAVSKPPNPNGSTTAPTSDNSTHPVDQNTGLTLAAPAPAVPAPWPSSGPSSWIGVWPPDQITSSSSSSLPVSGRTGSSMPMAMAMSMTMAMTSTSGYGFGIQTDATSLDSTNWNDSMTGFLTEPWTRAGGFPLAEDDALTTALTETDPSLAMSVDPPAHPPQLVTEL